MKSSAGILSGVSQNPFEQKRFFRPCVQSCFDPSLSYYLIIFCGKIYDSDKNSPGSQHFCVIIGKIDKTAKRLRVDKRVDSFPDAGRFGKIEEQIVPGLF